MDIDQLREICLSFPAVTEDVKWEHHLVFSVGDKMFCMVSHEPGFRCSLKVSDEDFEEISLRPGFAPAPYLARAKWVLLEEARLSKKEWTELLRNSYELVKARLAKRLKQKLGM